MFVLLTSVRHGLRTSSVARLFFFGELHWRLGGVATFLCLVAEFSFALFLTGFQCVALVSNKIVALVAIYPK